MNNSFLVSVTFLFTLFGCNVATEQIRKPNIILILIDDLGYGDLGCYGNKDQSTPNIDRLAQGGLILTDFHSNGPMCTPTRAALLTGKYQQRLGPNFEGPLSGATQHDEGMPLEAVTIAELLKAEGYTTGMFGKWHLGYKAPYLPTAQGFDKFVGLGAGDGDHHTHVDRWGRADWWHDDAQVHEPGYSVDLLTNHATSFIDEHKSKPFFVYLAHLAIHFPWQGPNDPPQRDIGNSYEKDKWGIIPDSLNVKPHINAMINAVDESVGQIVETLKNLKLVDNSLVIFTSDNGGYVHYNHLFENISNNGPLRGQKTEVYEGGHRVPFIASWPGKIGPGRKSSEQAITMDLLPTFLEIAGSDSQSNYSLDGLSMAPILFDREPMPRRSLFWKMDDESAMRMGPWKMVKIGENPLELYNLDNDIGESINLFSEEKSLADSMWSEYLSWEQDVTANWK